MEQWIRNNFKIYIRNNEDGTQNEVFEYEGNNGNKRTTVLSIFLNNQNKFQDMINYWKSQGMIVPQ